jgi:hypothetical protein
MRSTCASCLNHFGMRPRPAVKAAHTSQEPHEDGGPSTCSVAFSSAPNAAAAIPSRTRPAAITLVVAIGTAAPAICVNTKKVRRDRLEAAILDALFNELFTPEAVAYLTHQIDAAIARTLEGAPATRPAWTLSSPRSAPNLRTCSPQSARASSPRPPKTCSTAANAAWRSAKLASGPTRGRRSRR